MQFQDALREVFATLNDLGVDGALLGGLAVSVWTDPRFTRDIDLAVAVSSDVDAERMIYSMQQRGYRLSATVEQTATSRLATARMLAPGESEDGLVVDLLFASSGIESEIVRDAALVDVFENVSSRVARPGHLVALKLLAHDPVTRPQDGVDLRALRAILDAEEIDRAKTACSLIEARGYHRGRDLEALLDAFLSP